MKINLSFLNLLAILFIGLKLTGNIAWSWWWVLSPIWIQVIAVIGFLFFMFVLALIAAWMKA